jgi:7-keto-8-aminopelargonate synthetase-like enzyme
MEVNKNVTEKESKDKPKLARQFPGTRKAFRRSHQAGYPKPDQSNYCDFTMDAFAKSDSIELEEVTAFNQWRTIVVNEGCYTYEVPRLRPQTPETVIVREHNTQLKVLNFANYNYLGYGYHPEVIAAAKQALDQYGLGAGASPVSGGTLMLHKQLEQQLIKFLGLPDYGVSLFSSGYGANLGTISAYIKPGNSVVLDQASHMSLIEGAQLAGAQVDYFKHNNIQHLEKILQRIADGKKRILVCTEGVYSADGDYGKIREIVAVAKRYQASVLVDEAHSMLLAGPNGRGACEEQGVLADVDLIVLTFSKSLSGVGGCLIARKEITQYVNFYARCRMFSCGLDPAVTGGMLKALELAGSADGAKRRQKLKDNADYLRSLLRGKVNIGESKTWIVPIIFGSEKMSLPLSNHLQYNGMEVSMMQYPAVPLNKARIRMFVTSEHTAEQLERAAEILVEVAKKFGFYTGNDHA